MEKDRRILGLGYAYIFSIILYWIVMFLPFTFSDGSSYFTATYFRSPWGFVLFLPGGIFLLISSILILIFLTSLEDWLNNKLELDFQGWNYKLGYYSAMIGGVLGFGHLGALVPQPYYFPSFPLPTCGLLLTLFLMISGSLLYYKESKTIRLPDNTNIDPRTSDESDKPVSYMPSPITTPETGSGELVNALERPKCEMCHDTGICYKCAGLGEVENETGEIITYPICTGTGSCICEKLI